MGTVLKALSGATILVTGASGAYFLMSPKTIRIRLERKGYTVLNTENHDSSQACPDCEHWKKKVEKWDEVTKFINNNGSSSSSQDENPKIRVLKEKCKSVLDVEGSDEEYKSAEKYCAIKEVSKNS